MAERLAGEPIRLAVFGHPVAHSKSPAIHRLFAAQFGLEVDYRTIDATADTFVDEVRRLAAAGGRGCNVTVPLKREAWQAAARCSAVADRAEAANTLVFESASDWFADNTDGRGLVRDLARNLPSGVSGLSVLLLGAGGAAAGVVGDLLLAGVAKLVIANRTPERAEALAIRHADLGPVTAGGLDVLETGARFELVINATSAGHEGRTPVLRRDLFTDGGLCYDLNYGTAADRLRGLCAEIGVGYVDGLGMLVEQAGLSFELWTGRSPQCRPVLRRLREART